MRIAVKIACVTVGAALVATAFQVAMGYRNARQQYIAGVDRQLTAAAAALPGVLGEGYLDAAQAGTLSAETYGQTVADLSALADRSGLVYLYVFSMKDDEVVHLATSATPEERKQRNWSHYLMPYEQPPGNLLATFRDGQQRFAEYTDEYGAFRSIFVRNVGPGRRTYVVGADVSLAEIHADLRTLVTRSLLAGLGVAVLASAVGIYLSRRLSRPLDALTHEVVDWSRRGFVPDDQTRARLAEIGERQRDEVGVLSKRFVDVQDRLGAYLVELTQATEARQKIEHQLEIAKSIQEGLLPDRMPTIPNFEIVGWSKPADQTGGDYFDWVDFPDGKVMLSIADVTGHGIGPALVTAASRAYARATFQSDQALEQTVARLNDLLHSDLKGNRFVTLIACLLDPAERTLSLVAAGHGPILFYSRRRDAVSINEDTHGIPLGVFGQCEYDPPTTFRFEPGDMLVLVSDGFLDWMDAESETFGTSRLAESVLRSCREDPARIIDRLREDIAAFNGGRDQHDDTTALVIRCIA